MRWRPAGAPAASGAKSFRQEEAEKETKKLLDEEEERRKTRRRKKVLPLSSPLSPVCMTSGEQRCAICQTGGESFSRSVGHVAWSGTKGMCMQGRIRELEEIRAELAEKELVLLGKEQELLERDQSVQVLREEASLPSSALLSCLLSAGSCLRWPHYI